LENQTVSKAVTGSRVQELRGASLELLASTELEIIISGPAGTGKSIGVFHKLHTLCEAYAGIRVLVLRKTRASLTESGMVTFEDKVLPVDHPVRFGARGQPIERKNRSSYHYPNGSEMVMNGLEEKTRLFSTEWDIVYWMECTEATFIEWQSLLRSLRNNKLPYQQLIGDCNPDHPEHWIKSAGDEGSIKLLESRHEDNPALFDLMARAWTAFGLMYLKTLDKLKGALYQRLRLGRWVAAEGVVYENFDRAVHVIPRFEIPKHWRRFRAIDFGYTNPFVCQWWAVTDDGALILYREIYATKKLVQDLAIQIKQLSENENIEATLADHDAEDRATLERGGIKARAAQKEIKTGIQAVEKRLKVMDNGKAQIYFFEDSLVELDESLKEAKKPFNTLGEFSVYVWHKDHSGKAVKEIPVDLHNHGMDTMRYMVNHLAAPPKTPPRKPSTVREY
jgi:PBSX family phage terminase large subunit